MAVSVFTAEGCPTATRSLWLVAYPLVCATATGEPQTVRAFAYTKRRDGKHAARTHCDHLLHVDPGSLAPPHPTSVSSPTNVRIGSLGAVGMGEAS
jgi:hypothetical protein